MRTVFVSRCKRWAWVLTCMLALVPMAAMAEQLGCELVQQLQRQILPRMSVRVVKDNVRCSAGLWQVGPRRLTVSALVRAD